MPAPCLLPKGIDPEVPFSILHCRVGDQSFLGRHSLINHQDPHCIHTTNAVCKAHHPILIANIQRYTNLGCTPIRLFNMSRNFNYAHFRIRKSLRDSRPYTSRSAGNNCNTSFIRHYSIASYRSKSGSFENRI